MSKRKKKGFDMVGVVRDVRFSVPVQTVAILEQAFSGWVVSCTLQPNLIPEEPDGHTEK